jgi:ATP-dependent DNA helicase RecQ
VVEAVRAHGPLEARELQTETELSETRLATALARLEEAGAVEVRPDGAVARAPAAPPPSEAVRAAAEAEEKRRSFDRSRVDMMRAYAELQNACRREFLLSYFGEPFEGPCGNCDTCQSGAVAAAPGGPFPVGARVRHPKWGEATVQRYEEDKVVVLFDSVGYKALVLDVAADLLEPV